MICCVAKARNLTAADELGQRLTELHDRAGQPAFRQVALELVERMGRLRAPSDTSVRNAHHGVIDPETCDYEMLAGLAAYYRVEVSALGPVAANRQDVIEGLKTGRFPVAAAPVEMHGHRSHRLAS